MEEIKQQELLELKEWYVKEGRGIDILFQILFLLEDAKPGVKLQTSGRRLRTLKKMLQWFGLYVSTKHSGYATKDKALYNEWNKIFGFKEDAARLLGYPKCCVGVYKLSIHAFDIQLYSFIKQIRLRRKSVDNLGQVISNFRFLHHIPCKIDCAESINLCQKYSLIINKYNWLVEDLLADYNKQKIKVLIQGLELLQETIYPVKAELQNQNLLHELGLEPDDVREILENEKSFDDNIKFGRRLLGYFL